METERPSFKIRVALRTLRRRLLAEIGERGPEIEHRLGWAPGRLDEILTSEADLKVEDFLLIAEAAGLEPGRLFQEESKP